MKKENEETLKAVIREHHNGRAVVVCCLLADLNAAAKSIHSVEEREGKIVILDGENKVVYQEEI